MPCDDLSDWMLLHPPTVKPTPTDARLPRTPLADALAGAAAATDVSLDEFMRTAWLAYMESRPGLRQRMEAAQLIEQLRALRERGMVGKA